MTVRRIARPLLAAVFISDGIEAVKHPEPLARNLEATRPMLARVAGERTPADLGPLVRICGAANVVAGLMLAMGKAPRTASWLLLLAAAPLAVARNPQPADLSGEARRRYLDGAVRQGALFGGLLIAGADTAGKPSVGWRLDRARAERAAAKASAA